jgi:hypothetical protein
MIVRQYRKTEQMRLLLLLLVACLCITSVQASYGDRLPEFQDCVEASSL